MRKIYCIFMLKYVKNVIEKRKLEYIFWGRYGEIKNIGGIIGVVD